MKQWIAIIILSAGSIALAVVGATERKGMAQRIDDLREGMAQRVDNVHDEMSKRLDDVQADNAFLSELMGVYQEGLKKTSRFTLATSDDLATISEHALAVTKDVTQNMQDIGELKELVTLLSDTVSGLTDSVNGLLKQQDWLLQQWKVFLDRRS